VLGAKVRIQLRLLQDPNIGYNHAHPVQLVCIVIHPTISRQPGPSVLPHICLEVSCLTAYPLYMRCTRVATVSTVGTL
jgi:hypothetical protein